MKVHVVTQEIHGDSILARLARTFPEHCGFTLSDQTRSDVDLNYYFPYLFWDNDLTNYNQTYTAGWFTHKDEMHSPRKGRAWDQVAGLVNLRLASAHKYQQALLPYGTSMFVTPPLDMKKFTPRVGTRIRPARPRVGVAGFVYAGGRKGEYLVKKLATRHTHYDLRAAGRGWPIPCNNYPWATFETFYQDLDVFLCTSLVEGIGYPPLEALACGIPVVIPRDVGLFDDLPDVEGVYRFDAGDFDSMELALQSACDRIHDPQQLRALVGGYTMNAWANDHYRAFEALIHAPVPYTEPSPDWQTKAGVMYFAYGKPARDCAVDALASWHKHMSPLPAALVSDKPLKVEDRFIQFPDHDIGARWAKTKIYDLAPPEWEYVMYLDADTEVVADIRFLFKVLADGWELVICKNPDKYHTTRRMVRPDNQDECALTFEAMGTDDALQWNGGVFAFRRCPRTEAFFKAWHEAWQQYGKRDQAALLRAMWRYPLRVYTLGNEWNTVTHYNDPNSTAGILHYSQQARRYQGAVQGRLDSAEAWSKIK